jgi:glyoxylase-like metal-dependent hydrolase (beta-lactamase superfamily II)
MESSAGAAAEKDGGLCLAHRAGLARTSRLREAPEAVMGKSWFMKRIALAAIAATIMLFAGNAIAQQPIDWDKIQIKTTYLGNKTYMLEGQGGNITVAVGTDGIIMVDTQFAPLSDKIKAAIKEISPLPIKYIINTHFHGDHTGGEGQETATFR